MLLYFGIFLSNFYLIFLDQDKRHYVCFEKHNDPQKKLQLVLPKEGSKLFSHITLRMFRTYKRTPDSDGETVEKVTYWVLTSQTCYKSMTLSTRVSSQETYTYKFELLLGSKEHVVDTFGLIICHLALNIPIFLKGIRQRFQILLDLVDAPQDNLQPEDKTFPWVNPFPTSQHDNHLFCLNILHGRKFLMTLIFVTSKIMLQNIDNVRFIKADFDNENPNKNGDIYYPAYTMECKRDANNSKVKIFKNGKTKFKNIHLLDIQNGNIGEPNDYEPYYWSAQNCLITYNFVFIKFNMEAPKDTHLSDFDSDYHIMVSNTRHKEYTCTVRSQVKTAQVRMQNNKRIDGFAYEWDLMFPSGTSQILSPLTGKLYKRCLDNLNYVRKTSNE